MKTHKMRLLPEYFEYMKTGTKKLEIRLNDEKRKNIKIGDLIIFEKLDDTQELLKTKVTNLYYYSDFNELINENDVTLLADKSVSKEKLIKTLNEIYSKVEQDKYGVVAIEIEKIKVDKKYNEN